MSRDLALENGLPASIDGEQLILGSLLIGAEYQLVAGILQAGDFILEKHRRIFTCIGDLYSAGTGIDTFSVANELLRRGQLESCDGPSYVLTLKEDLPRIPNLEHCCKVVKDKSILRQLIFGSQKLIERCLLGGDLPGDVLAIASEMIRRIEGETAPKATLRSFGEILEAHGGLNAYAKTTEAGIQTPWPSLNRIIGGFLPGQMITIAGLTGSGKSAAALQIAQHTAAQGVGVAIFSLEMSAKEILDRAACSRAGIDSKKLERGTLSQVERYEFQRAMAELNELPVFIDDSTNCTLPAMHAALRKHMQKHAIGLLIIDYLQLMQILGKKENRTQEVTEISRGMKLAAREFGVPVIVLAQFNRGPAAEKREPQLHDLRESGSIEQDSDKVIFLHPKTKAAPDAPLEVSMIVAKQRNGRSRRYLDMLFFEQYTRFEERTKKQDDDRLMRTTEGGER
jgi:replicative DNA helicase